MRETVVSVNAVNFLTVGIMTLVFSAVLGFLMRLYLSKANRDA
jgi:hypothetical protein